MWAELDPSSITTTHIHSSNKKKCWNEYVTLYLHTWSERSTLSREDIRYEIHFVWRSFESTNNSRMIGILFMTNMCSESCKGCSCILFILSSLFHYCYFYSNKIVAILSFDNCLFKKLKVQLFCKFQVFCDENVNVADFEPLYQSIH